jgi:hypothetical protein
MPRPDWAGIPAWARDGWAREVEDEPVEGEEGEGEEGEDGEDGEGEVDLDWLPPGLRDGLPEHLGGGLPPGWGGTPPGQSNRNAAWARCLEDEDDGVVDGVVTVGGVTVLSDGTLFDEAYYLENNPDVAAAGVSPEQHFIEYGYAEGRAYFDPENPPDLGTEGVFEVTVTNEDGTEEVVTFDSLYYLAENPDVAAAGVSPLEHYLLYGQYEDGREPSPVETVFIGDDTDNILEGDVGNNTFNAGAGNDTINAGAGQDLIDAGAGDDTISTGTDDGEADVLVFEAGDGNDLVTDLGAEDLLMIDAALGFVDGAAVLAAASETDEGVVLALAEGQSVTLAGLTLDDMSADMFQVF